LKLIDFGFSKYFKNEILEGAVGTRFYLAPEMIISDEYDERCDLWSLGVIVFMCMSGRPPFFGADFKETLELITKGVYEYPKGTEFADDVKNFIAKLLALDPTQRYTAQQALEDQWLKSDVETGSLNGNVLQSLRTFAHKSALQRLVLQIVAFDHIASSEDINQLKEDFARIDASNTGEITLSDLSGALRKNFSSMSHEDIKSIFLALDFDRTGYIHWHEFIATQFNLDTINEGAVRNAFNRLDCDGSGSISIENMMDMIGDDMDRDEVVRMVRDCDQNGNGMIDFKEFVAAVKSKTKSYSEVSDDPAVISSMFKTKPEPYNREHLPVDRKPGITWTCI